jgi:hypothetical protein
MDQFYMRRSADLAPTARTNVHPDGQPAPTGYYRDMTGVNQGRVSISRVPGRLYHDYGTVGHYNDERIDQHGYLQVSATWSPAPAGPRRDGRDDPLVSGPPMPTPRRTGLFWRIAAGTSKTQLDDVPGHVFPKNGSQDGASWTWFCDPKLQLAPYTPDPRTGQNPDSLRSLEPSPAHGWTSQPVLNIKAVENAKALALIQQQAGRNDRLAPSTYAGQSFSARTSRVSNPAGATMTPSRRTRG